MDETLALRTNLIWSKGRVEYTSLAETFVFLRAFVVKKQRKSALTPLDGGFAYLTG